MSPPAEDWIDDKVIRPVANPIRDVGGLVSLFGSLAPSGAILKRAAATPALFEKTARAVVFDGIADLAKRIDDPNLDVEADDVLVLRNAGPRAMGMPEAGYLPIPAKLARQGVKGHAPHVRRPHVRHRLRHHRPAHLAGVRRWRPAGEGPHRRQDQDQRQGPRARSASRSAELAARTALPPPPADDRGWAKLYREHVMQAEAGLRP